LSSASVLSISNAYVLIAPTSFTLGATTVTAGFNINGTFSFLGAPITIQAGLSKTSISVDGASLPFWDLELGFSISNVDFPVIGQSLSIAQTLYNQVASWVNSKNQQCGLNHCVSILPSSTIDGFLSTIENDINSLLSINYVSLTNFSLLNVLSGGSGPTLSASITLLGNTYTWSTVLDFSDLGASASSVATKVWSSLQTQFSNADSTLVSALETYACNAVLGGTGLC